MISDAMYNYYMKKVYYILTFCLLYSCASHAQTSNEWLPADTIYQWAVEAYLEHDSELVDQTSMYLWNASKYYLKNNDYQRAFKYAFSERDITQLVHGRESHPYALSLGNIAGIYSRAKLYEEAISYNTQAYDIELKMCGSDSSALITPLHNIACDMSALREDIFAVDIIKQAIRYKLQAQYSTESIFSSLSALAVMYSHLGDYEAAYNINSSIVNYRESVSIDETLVIAYSNVASDLAHLGLTERAIEYVDKGLCILNDSLDMEESALSAVMYSNLSGYYITMKRYDKAIDAAEKAIRINEHIHHPSDAEYGFISYAYEQIQDTSNALKYGKLAVDAIEKCNGDNNGRYIISKNNYSMSLYKFGYIREYIKEYLELYRKLKIYLISIMYHGTFSSNTKWEKFMYDITLHQRNLNAITQSGTLRNAIYDNVLFYKGILLDREQFAERSMISHGKKEQYDSLKNAYYTTHEKDEKLRIKFAIEDLEKYSVDATINVISIDDLKKELKASSVAVEFLIGELNKTNTYYALIVRKDWNAPKCVILGEEAQLDSMPYSQLQQTVWQAIIDSAQIKKGENIYFAPDGIFYNIPIEYLPLADGRNISDVYNMFRVSSTRELCFRDSTRQAYSSAVLYGGLKYDAMPQQGLYAQNRSDYRGIDNMSETVWTQWRAEDRAKYNYLPYTLKEVDSISNTIRGSLHVTTYTDEYGDEKSFKALSGNSPSILHVATHGYYITPTQAEVMSRERLAQYGVSPTDERQSVIDYSMERTGLLLAGAQYTLRGDTLPQDADDGILSAKEISHLDLTNTDLVVLSACKTALGDVTNDGVAGLQRGFKIAGVKSILMSLWQVDDAATYLLMKRFYQSLVSGKSKQQALREAQQALRSYKTQDDYPYSDIRYWGAFVLLDAIE